MLSSEEPLVLEGAAPEWTWRPVSVRARKLGAQEWCSAASLRGSAAEAAGLSSSSHSESIASVQHLEGAEVPPVPPAAWWGAEPAQLLRAQAA